MDTLMLRRNMMMAGRDLQFLEYIVSDGDAYIDTGINAVTPMTMEVKLTPVFEANTVNYLGASGGTESRMYFGQWGTSADQAYRNYFYVAENSCIMQGINKSSSIDGSTPFIFRLLFGTGATTTCGISAKTETETTYTSGTGTANPPSVSSNLTLYILARNVNGSPGAKASAGTKIHSWKIYNDQSFSNLIFYGRPCKYNGEYGLWDDVTSTFFGNASQTGAFAGQ